MVDFLLVKAISKGIITFVPCVNNLLNKKKTKSIHSESNAEFCYTFWLKKMK
jgi:hypothetical protein